MLEKGQLLSGQVFSATQEKSAKECEGISGALFRLSNTHKVSKGTIRKWNKKVGRRRCSHVRRGEGAEGEGARREILLSETIPPYLSWLRVRSGPMRRATLGRDDVTVIYYLLPVMSSHVYNYPTPPSKRRD
jgi:hypothetical protein